MYLNTCKRESKQWLGERTRSQKQLSKFGQKTGRSTTDQLHRIQEEKSSRSNCSSNSHLDPCQKDCDRDGRVELCLPVAEKLEVSELVRLVQQVVQFAGHSERAVDVEDDADQRDNDHEDVQDVPERLEVLELVTLDLEDLLNHVVDDEEAEDTLACHYEVVHNLK